MRKIVRKPPDSEIPTASMADIAFLLIVFFMVTAVFASTKGLEFKLPQEEQEQAAQEEEAVFIQVFPGDAIAVDCTPFSHDQILDYLAPKLERNPMKPVIIRLNEMTEYGYMVSVFDELRQAPEKIGIEVKNVSIPTQREIDMFWY